MDRDTQNSIVEGLRRRDREAWMAFYSAFAEPIWRRTSQLMGPDQADVPEVVQEVFLTAARAIHQFDAGRGSLWTWLWGIARRRIALYYRRRSARRRLAVSLEWWASLNGRVSDWLAADGPEPAEVLEAEELRTLVRHSLACLKPDYQDLLIAKYVEGRAIAEIAGQRGDSPESVHSRLARARRAFRKVFHRTTQVS